MIPVWAKDKEGKWQPFPTQLVETLSDGSLGFRFELGRDNTERRKFFLQFRQHFENNPVGWTSQTAGLNDYRLWKQPTNE